MPLENPLLTAQRMRTADAAKKKATTAAAVPAFSGDTSGMTQEFQTGALTMPAMTPPPGVTAPGRGRPPPGATDALAAWGASLNDLNGEPIPAQMQNARAVGQNIQGQAQGIFAGQQGTAAGYQQQGQGFNVSAPMVGGGGAFQTNAPQQPAGIVPTPGRNVPTNAFAANAGLMARAGAASSRILGGPAPAPGAPSGAPAPQGGGGYQVGERMPMGGGTRAPGAVMPGQLGQVGNVAGQLGAGPQAAGVGNVAGRLGAGPQVGSVGNIGTGAAPGSVQGSFGTMGQSSAAQQGMMGRLEGFLDGPQGPSMAEAQLRESQADNMANLLGAARSGRGGAGAQAQALRGAMSEGSAVMSDTAGQLATLRAQEEDMLKNRQLSAIGLGGEMSTAARGQDLSYRGQDLSAAQGDQSTQLGARGQDLTASMANQSTQTQLEQLRASTALGARGQDLSAMQGDQGTQAQMSLGQLQASLGARGQDLSALQGDQGTALGARGQDLSALQGNQSTQLGARGQDVTRELGLGNINMGLRGQDASVLTGDADRSIAAQQLGLQAGLGYGQLANEATGQGLSYLGQSNQQALMGEGMAQDAANNWRNNFQSGLNTQVNAQAGILNNNNTLAAQPSEAEKMLYSLPGYALQAGGGLGAAGIKAGSDERAKTDIAPLDAIGEHLRGAPGYSYKYKKDNPFGEDPDVPHAGPMAGDLEKGPFGRELVMKGPQGMRMVNTTRLSLVNHAGLASLRGELDRLREELGL